MKKRKAKIGKQFRAVKTAQHDHGRDISAGMNASAGAKSPEPKRKVKISIWIDSDARQKVDKLVYERKQAGDRSYGVSKFIREAILEKLERMDNARFL